MKFMHKRNRKELTKKKEPKSLKRRLVFFIIFCWGVPVLLILFFTIVSYREGIIKKTETLVEGQMESAASFISIRIEDAINLCQRPSYERTWEHNFNNYNSGVSDRAEYLRDINNSLYGKFSADNRFRMYAYYEAGESQPSCFSSGAGVDRRGYMEEIDPRLKEWIEKGSDYVHIQLIQGRLFLVRNLYTTREYKYFGTLVVELNTQMIFKDIPQEQLKSMVFCIDDERENLNYPEDTTDTEQKAMIDKLLRKYNGFSNGTVEREESPVYKGYFYQKKFDNYHMGIVYLAQKQELYSALYELYRASLVVLLMLIPIIAYIIYFLNKQIREPVERLKLASQAMEDGDIGVEIKGGNMPNAEFNYLMESFNSMSTQVKELFDRIYDEKLSRKDAQILALQAQIDPHFLNNTLEMMNWQARMNGDTVVSKMIESLGTVLDYRMNRANVKEIHLADELRCTDAYFYIMSMRFGQRLMVTRDIDQELMYINVPPLILQPLVENAVVHGVEAVKSGTIKLNIYHDEEYVYIKVSNTGKAMSKAEQERIQCLLNGDEDKIPKGKGKHTSIGIRNVNSRVKLMYGEKYGLSIHQEEEELTVSTILLPYHSAEDEQEEEQKQKQRQEKEREEVEKELIIMHKSGRE